MRIVVAPDKFKGTLDADGVAEQLRQALHDGESHPEPLRPVALQVADLLEQAVEPRSS